MDNKKTSGKISLTFGITWLLTLILLVVSLLFEIGLGLASQIGLLVFILIIAVVFRLGGFFYIELETDKRGFRIKHYNLFPFWKKFQVYQLKEKSFNKFEIKKYAGGLFSWLYIYEKTSRGLAKYPAIGVSALSAADLRVLVGYLESIQQ